MDLNFKGEWYPIYGPKGHFQFGEKRSIACYCTHKQTGFTENGCNGNQPQPSEVVVYSIDANNSSSFPKQDLTVKQAYRVSLSFVRRRKLNLTKYACLTVKSCFGNSYFQCFLRAFSSYATSIGQIIPCHVTDVKILQYHTPFGLWLAQVSGILLKYLAK